MMSNKHKKSFLVGSHKISSSSRQHQHDRHDTVLDRRPMTPITLEKSNNTNQSNNNLNNQLLNSDLNY